MTDSKIPMEILFSSPSSNIWIVDSYLIRVFREIHPKKGFILPKFQKVPKRKD